MECHSKNGITSFRAETIFQQKQNYREHSTAEEIALQQKRQKLNYNINSITREIKLQQENNTAETTL